MKEIMIAHIIVVIVRAVVVMKARSAIGLMLVNVKVQVKPVLVIVLVNLAAVTYLGLVKVPPVIVTLLHLIVTVVTVITPVTVTQNITEKGRKYGSENLKRMGHRK